MRGKLKSWQLFGILSGFCFLYTLFFPFKEIKVNETEQNVFGYEFLTNLMLELIKSVLTNSITETPFQYAFDYFTLIVLIIMLVSLVILLWTSISANAFITIPMSLIYSLSAWFIIFYILDYSVVISFKAAYFLFIVSSLFAFITPIVYKIYN